MQTQLIERQFERIGARANVHRENGRFVQTGISIDIGRDDEGEFFDITVNRNDRPDVRVLDIQPRLRHLLLMSEQNDGKHKFLCGHDERHGFVAAVPERESASNVKTAFEALKPPGVKYELNRQRVKRKKRNRRRNEAFVRRGGVVLRAG